MISLVAPVSLLHPHSRYEGTDHRIDAVSSCLMVMRLMHKVHGYREM